MPLKPRIVLAILVGASILGVSLTWTRTTELVVIPLAMWIAIVSLGTLLRFSTPVPASASLTPTGAAVWEVPRHTDGGARPRLTFTFLDIGRWNVSG